MLLEKDVLKICSKFTGENPCQSVISIKLQSMIGKRISIILLMSKKLITPKMIKIKLSKRVILLRKSCIQNKLETEAYERQKLYGLIRHIAVKRKKHFYEALCKTFSKT